MKALIKQMWDMVTQTSRGNRIKDWSTDKAFQAQEHRFLCERGANVGADFELFNFKELLHALEPRETH